LTPLWLCLSFSPSNGYRAKSKAAAKRKRRQATALQDGLTFNEAGRTGARPTNEDSSLRRNIAKWGVVETAVIPSNFMVAAKETYSPFFPESAVDESRGV
jgi:hypothetical protein